MRPKLIAGNWKMHGSRQLVEQLVSQLAAAPITKAKLVIIPPFPYLAASAALSEGSNLQLGAQDCSAQDVGAFTGEVSATMLADLNVSYVLVGHSERRQYHQETNQLLLAKTRQALAAGLQPILCLGETFEEHQQEQTLAVVSEQLNAIAQELTAEELSRLVLAYEPVWAIGTGLTATPEQAQAVHASLRAVLSQINTEVAAQTLILYGGSMKADNAAALLAMPDIDGGLVGGASLDADQFLAIAQTVE